MATIRCPQCGTEIKDGSTEFCPNPNCGFPLSFATGSEEETGDTPMERRPLEQAPPTPTVPTPKPTPPVTPTPVVPPPPTPPPPTKASGANPALLIGGVVVAVGLIVAGVIVFAGGGEDEPEQPDGKPPVEAPAQLDFTRVAADEAVFGGDADQYIHRVVAGEDGLIAVGSDGPPGEFDAAVWTSTDGQTWSRVPTPADPLTFGGSGEQEMLGITQGPEGRYVIVGRDNSGGDDNAAVWTYDGLVFSRVDPAQPALGGPGKQVMTRVIRGAQRYIGVGTTGLSDDGTPDGGLWLSVDGQDWAADTSQLALKGAGDQFMRTIVQYDDEFVGAGREELTDDYDAAVWKSDGSTFRRVGTDDAFGGPSEQQIYTVATGGPGLVAVGVAGSGGNPDASVWVSEDGDSWEQLVDDAVFGGPGPQLMLGVASTPAGLLAVGYDGAQAPQGVLGDEAKPFFEGAVWHSADGMKWDRIFAGSFGGAEEQQIKSIAVFQDTVVVVGWDGSGGDLDAAVWTAPLPD